MKLVTLIFSLISFSIFAQAGFDKASTQLNNLLSADSDDNEHLVWVFFKDKGENISQYFVNPESVVSERSLKRRSKVLPPGELISIMDIPVNQEYINELKNIGFKVKHVSKWFNGVSGYMNKSEAGMISELTSVKKMDVVKKYKKKNPVTENYNYTLQAGSSLQPEGIYTLNYGQSFTQLNLIKVPQVHDLGYTGKGILICSMDAGFDNLAHEVFDSLNIVDMWDFVDNDPDPSQLGSHGTKTLSTIGGFKEGELIGSAFDADFLLARTENDNSPLDTPVEEDNWIAAMEWAESKGVDVTTTSLGYLEYSPPDTSYTWLDMDGNTARITIAADLAVKLGIVVVNSAGNESYNPDHNTLSAPADGDSVITVGSVTSNGGRSSFSSVGPTSDGRIKPDLMAMGSSVWVATSLSSSSYGRADGTSLSCPLLAGAVALMLSADSTLTPMKILSLLRQTASKSSSPDNLMGWGIINTLDAINAINSIDELISFTGNYGSGEVILNWTILSETYTVNFDIQRREINSDVISEWQTVETLDAYDTTSQENDYTYRDNVSTVNSSIVEYRLKQNDSFGNSFLSNIVRINISGLSTFHLFQNYPNPFNPTTTIKFYAPTRSEIKITVYDIIGNKLETLFNGILPSDFYYLDFNAANRPSGVYFISLQADNFSQTIKATLIK